MRDFLTIEVNGIEKKLRPSIAAIQAIESALQMTLGELVTAVQSSPNINLMIETLYQGFIAGENKVSRNEILELLEEEGLNELQIIVASFFSAATAGKNFKETILDAVAGQVAQLKAKRIQALNDLKEQLQNQPKTES